MSKHKSNVNPDHYKTAGREPPGRDLDPTIERRAYAQSLAKEKRNPPRSGAEDLPRPPKNANQDDGQGSAKTGKKSSTQKMEATRSTSAPIPAAKPVAGAFGRERRPGKGKKR